MISAFQYQEMQRRLAGNAVRQSEPCAATEPCNREAELHEQIRKEIASRGWLGFHGSMAHRSHRTVGEPDWIVLADQGRVFFIEAKSRTGKLSKEQCALRAWIEKLGHVFGEVRNIEGFLNLTTNRKQGQ